VPDLPAARAGGLRPPTRADKARKLLEEVATLKKRLEKLEAAGKAGDKGPN